LLCYRCGSLVPDNSETCATCGLKLAGAAPGGAAPRRRPGSVEAPYKPGDVFAKRYAIREVLGPGPVGHVFRALDQEMDVEVALKIINPRLVQMPEERTQFSLALRAGKRLTHPHHMRVYEEGEERNRPYFTTQLLEGTTLRRMMEQRAAQGQRLSPQEVEPLLAQLAEALASAHKFGPHSDLKPENIFVLPDQLKVTDYGLALGIPRLPFLQAQKGWRVASYVAPEYSEGSELDTRMDIYSLGVLLGELLTGQLPEEGQVPDLLARVPELPSGLEALYRRATNANPLARPATAGEFLAEYKVALSSRPKPVPPRPAAGMAPTPALNPPRVAKPVPISLTAELAKASLGPGRTMPPVPTAELPALAAPTIKVPAVSGPTQEAPRTTLESPTAGAPTIEMPREEAPPLDATQPLDSATLAAIMGTASKGPVSAPASKGPASKPAVPGSSSKSAVPGSSPKARPVPDARAEPPSPPPPPPGVAAPRSVPASRSPVGLVLLTLAGLGLGALGGYALLTKLRQPAEAPPASTGSTVSLGQGDPSVAAPPGPAAAEAVAPAGGCPQGMLLVGRGFFKMGAETPAPGLDEPKVTSRMVDSFCIDQYEFPNQEGELPRVNVSWSEAKAECVKLGKRLCTEQEWEKACKGVGSAPFPYGAMFDPDTCNTEGARGNGRSLAASGSFPGCQSNYRVFDMSGNAAEWTDTRYGTNLERTQKGGSFDRAEDAAHCAARKNGDPEVRSATVGFRCCAEMTR
jgi:serine/threonine protein kinase/formylglycine-generating enzyme required for sulfatase activity